MTDISRFSSAHFGEADRVAALQDIYAVVEQVDIDLIGEGTPFFDVAIHALPETTLLDATISPMSPRRTRAQTSNGKDDLVLAFINDGDVSFAPEGGEELELRAGDVYLGINTRASRHTLQGTPKFLDITIPRAVLAPLVKNLDQAMRGRLTPSPQLGLLRNYAQMLTRQAGPLAMDLALRCADHIRDLAVLALGARPDAAEQATGRGLRHVRLAAIRSDVKANAAQRWLSLETMARRHGISPQYLRSLFYKDGTSFSDFVRHVRLDHALRMLTDPGGAAMRVGDIAVAAGFDDLSHFNRSFRARYGMTPSDARASAGGIALSK